MIKRSAVLWGILFGLVAARSWAATGTADLKGTAVNSPIKGTVKLQDSAEGLKISAQLVGVPPGQHGFHIHEFGDCAEMGKAAGGHYNPMSAPHGNVVKDGTAHAHVGDMGNITANANGEATLDVTLHEISL